MHQAVTLGHAATAGAVHAHGVHFVDIGQRIEFIGQIADRLDRAEIAVHRIERFKRDQLGRRRVIGFQQFAQVIQIVVTEDALGPAVAAHAFDHRGMVQRVGIDDQPRKELGQRRQRGIVGNVGRGEQQRRFLAMQIRKLGLKPLVIDGGAGNVARPARTGAGGVDRLVHRVQHDRVLAHAQVIVAAPHRDRLLGAIGARPDRVRVVAPLAFDVDEGTVTTFGVQLLKRAIELGCVVHRSSPFVAAPYPGAAVLIVSQRACLTQVYE